MKRLKFILTIILALTLIVSGCSNKKDIKDEGNQQQTPVEEQEEPVNEETEEAVEFVDNSYVVNADWLKENMGKENFLILDARGADTHKKGHIPGAIAVMWQEFANMEGTPGKDSNWGTVLEPKDLSEKLSKYGITKDKEIVVYTTSPDGWGEDGRILWMLRMAGFNNTKILDGGFDFWKSKGYEVSKDDVVPTPATVTIESLDNKTNIDTEELASNLDKFVIIDVRGKDEYNGATNFGEPKGGHLPGAINIPFNEFLNKDGTLKTAKEIKDILDANGINKDDEIVTYCTAGIRSAHMQIVLTMMGYDRARNYDASFYSWSGSSDLEVVK
ncbi:sulfurtransferase [Tissierella praeacuta]|uniref:sulfurtransferase n=1 Tax=Tissierella praeacuta TaxID=43131 RepID=UPI003341B28F